MSDVKLSVADPPKVFKPSAPIDKKELFLGRTREISTVVNAIVTDGQHVVIYGERGVGKTSLATVIHDFSEVPSVKVTCHSKTTFTGLFRLVFEQINFHIQSPLKGLTDSPVQEQVDASVLLPEDKTAITPNEVRNVLKELIKKPLAIIIDELDRVESKSDRILIADTVKTLSDDNIPATLILVGVADSVGSLVEGHQSIARSLVQVRMPRMTQEELRKIIRKGLETLKMEIEEPAENRIVSLSKGLPHYTHQLALYASQAAILDESTMISIKHVVDAVRTAINQKSQTVRETFLKAVRSSRQKSMYREVLLSCALAPKDEEGYFKSVGVRDPLSRIMKKQYEISAFARHLKAFTDEKHGPVLEMTGQSYSFHYRFIDPLLEPYVLMDGLSEGLIDDSHLAE